MDTSLEALTGRIDRLERECRRWRRGGVALALGAAAVVAAGAAGAGTGKIRPDAVVTRRLAIVDAEGRERIWLVADVPKIGPAVVLIDEAGKPRATFNLNAPGFPLLRLNDAAGNARLLASAAPDGSPSIRLVDAEGHDLWSAGAAP